MAKKKTVKKVKKIEPKISEPDVIVLKKKDSDTQITELRVQILATNVRIDAIVAAHDKCKSLRGL